MYGADTAFGPHFCEAGAVNLAILGIGAYDPYIAAHATPEQAWAMAADMQAEYVLPMHHSTFRLSHEPMDEPLTRLLRAAGNQVDRVVCRRIGEVWTAPVAAAPISLPKAV